jgi:hypothetical protein
MIWQVYSCEHCARLNFGFESPEGHVGFFKFPPTIGAVGEAPLLFVGINPRRSASNQALHDSLMSDKSAFEALSRNVVGGKPYIGSNGTERHYRDHMRIVEGVFGPGTSFESVAAATELYFCATEDAGGLPYKSPCANAYFGRVYDQTRPKVVICVGKTVLRYFQEKFHGGKQEVFRMQFGGHSAQVVSIAHPNHDIGEDERRRLHNAAVTTAKCVLAKPSTES